MGLSPTINIQSGRGGADRRLLGWLLAVLVVSAALRLAPYWSGYRRVWFDQDAWLHLRTVETLRSLGPVGLLRAFHDRPLNQPDRWRSPFPPLVPALAAEASFVAGVEWAVRLIPIMLWLLAAVWLYRLARDWSVPAPDAILAVALAGFSIEMVRQQGMHFAPRAISALLGMGLLRSAYRLTQTGSFEPRRMAAVVWWAALSAVGFGPNLFHIGTVVVLAAGWQQVAEGRRRVMPVVAALAAGLALALPFVLTTSVRLPSWSDYFAPAGGLPRLATLRDLAAYPLWIGLPALLLAMAAVGPMAKACRARQPWAMWLAVWIGAIAPQTVVWLFVAPGPPFRLLVLLIPPLAIAAAVGFRALCGHLVISERQQVAARAGVGLLTAAVTAAFLAWIEIPRRRISDGEVEMYQAAARLLPPGAAVHLRANLVFWYYCRDRFADLAMPVSPEHSSPDLAAGSYWLISDREWRSGSPRRASYGKIVASGQVLFTKEDNRIVFLPASLGVTR